MITRNTALLSFLLASTTLPSCSAFSPARCHRNHQVLRAASSDDDESLKSKDIGNVATSAFLGLTLGLTMLTSPAQAITTADYHFPGPAITTLAAKSAAPKEESEEDIALKSLEQETRQSEKELKAEQRKAKLELKRKAFFEYDAKMAEEQEARIEAAERKAEIEYEQDKEEVETISLLELQKERELKLATTKKEKAEKQREVNALLKKEREIARKEREAKKMEKIFLAEEAQEKKILSQKENAKIKEEKKFEEVEKEFEAEKELVQEEEAELKLLKDLRKK